MPTMQSLIALLVDVVSKNGNLLLGVGPRADGSIPELQQQRLRGLAGWLETNGDAIFGTCPWKRHADVTDGGLQVRYTSKGESLYVVVLGTPGASFIVRDLQLPSGASVEHLGGRRVSLAPVPEGARLTCELPLGKEPAHAFRIWGCTR